MLITSVVPLVLTSCWVTGMVMSGSVVEEGECWDDYSDSATIYIIVIPMILALMVGGSNLTKILMYYVTCTFLTGQSWNSY